MIHTRAVAAMKHSCQMNIPVELILSNCEFVRSNAWCHNAHLIKSSICVIMNGKEITLAECRRRADAARKAQEELKRDSKRAKQSSKDAKRRRRNRGQQSPM
jgi:hypothetical protein